MAYIDVLTLAQAKTFLRIDDTLADDDAQVTQMISSALSTIERRTNVLVYARDKSYLVQDYEVKVYDFPINSITSPTTVVETERELYTTYTTKLSTELKVVLNVGYANVSSVPSALIDAALQLLKYMYYEAETNTAAKGNIPYWIQEMIDQHKRFII
tara:strand:+ start:33 stop:503 length:471 start_codon:yes stop_codon:yes gene_type:complete